MAEFALHPILVLAAIFAIGGILLFVLLRRPPRDQ